MKTQTLKKPVSSEDHKKIVRNVAGTMAIEGIILSEASIRNLDRYANGQASYHQIIAELKAKYKRA